MVRPTFRTSPYAGFISAPVAVGARATSNSWHGVNTSPLYCAAFIPRLHSLLPHRVMFRSFSVKNFAPRAVLGGGGILGVGPAEIVVIVAVGWLLLGPEKLYNLAKDTGKLFGELRRTASEAQDTFKDALESELDSKKDKNTSTENLFDSNTSKEENTENLNENGKNEFPGTQNPQPSPQAKVNEEGPTSPDLDIIRNQPDPQFLDQLRRVSDPGQAPPPEVPDLDVSIEMEERELDRLEEHYLQARARLEARKHSRSRATDGGNGSAKTNEKTEHFSAQSDATSKNT